MKIYRQLPPSLSTPKKVLLLIYILMSLGLTACSRDNWYETSRGSANLAPKPNEFNDAVVLAYRAKVWGVRGLVADHTWFATKPKGANEYTVYEVIGWRRNRYNSVVRIEKDIPDRYWFGNQPITMIDYRGPEYEDLVAKIDEAAKTYPYPNEYTAYPGPNSNTFTAWIANEVPELNLDLPVRAIGKNYPFDKSN